MSHTLDLDAVDFSSSREDIQRTMDTLSEQRVALVTLQFSDIAGGGRTVTIPSALLPRLFRRGFRFDGSAIAGPDRVVEIDLFLVPDPGTLIVLPETPGEPRRAQLSCWVTRKDRQPFAGDPRTVLQSHLLRAAGMGLDYRVGIELEFYLYVGDSVLTSEPGTTDHGIGYFSDGEDATAVVRDSIVATLYDLNIGVHGAHHETGPGQQELDLRHAGGIRVADQLTTTRQIIRTIAHRHGMRATFMAKPFAKAPGSGMHLFQRMLSLPDGKDLLFQADDDHELSPLARHMIAGQLAHAPAMSAVVNTTINSYKRVADGQRAPGWATWARVSGASLLRVPAAAPHTATDIELRSPDALANPYLALAVALAAALDGIERKMDPPPPFEENLVSYDENEFHRRGAVRLPQTLGEALEEFANDELTRDALGAYIHDQLITVKRGEWDAYRRYVSPWEQRRYGEL